MKIYIIIINIIIINNTIIISYLFSILTLKLNKNKIASPF